MSKSKQFPFNHQLNNSKWNYKAFLSYKHSEIGRRHAIALEKGLKRHAKPFFQRPFKIFRDEKHMVPSNDLSLLIKNGLEQSEFLIFIAEKEAANSNWCQDELEYWCNDLGRKDKLIIIHANDSIQIDTQNNSIDWDKTEALPKLLSKYITSIPLYVDAHWTKNSNEMTLENIRYKSIINLVVAKLRGITPEELNDEDLLIYRKNIRIRNGAIIILLMLLSISVFSSIWAFRQRNLANEQSNYAIKQTKIAEENERIALRREKEARANALALKAREVISKNQDYMLGLRLAQASYNMTSEPMVEAKETLSDIANLIITNSKNEGILYENKLEYSVNKDIQIEVSSDGKLMCILRDKNIIEIWDTEKFELIRGDVMFLSQEIMDFSFSSDNKTYMTFMGRSAHLKNINAEFLNIAYGPFGDDDRIYNGKYYSSDKVFLARNWKGEIVQFSDNEQSSFIWKSTPSKYLSRKQVFSNQLNFVLRAYSDEGAVLQFNNQTIDIKHKGNVQEVAVSNDDKFIATGGHEINIWNSRNGDLEYAIKDFEGYVTSIDFSNDGSRIVASTSMRKVYIWDLKKKKQIYFIDNFDEDVEFSSFGYSNYSVITKTKVNKIQFWKLQELSQMTKTKSFFNAGSIAKISKDRKKLIIGSATGGLSSLYDFNTGKLILLPSSIVSNGFKFELSKDSRYSAFAEFSGDISIVDLDSVKLIKKIKVNRNDQECIFSADGNFLFVATRFDGVQKWDWKNEKLIMTYKADKTVDFVAVDCTPDGTKLIGGGWNGAIYIWDINSGKLIGQHQEHYSTIMDIDISDDGNFVVTGSSDKNIIIWNILDINKPTIKTLEGHENDVNSVSISPDNKWVVSGSKDKSVRIWDIAEGVELFKLQEHSSSVRSACFFSIEPLILYSMGLDNNLITWNINLDIFNPTNYYQLNRKEKIEYDIPEEIFDNIIIGK